LLKDGRVIEEINRHKWFESEKVGYDIGFDRAAEDWLRRFSRDWMKLHPTPSREQEAVASKGRNNRK
jgi:hypothetical protein